MVTLTSHVLHTHSHTHTGGDKTKGGRNLQDKLQVNSLSTEIAETMDETVTSRIWFKKAAV